MLLIFLKCLLHEALCSEKIDPREVSLLPLSPEVVDDLSLFY